MVYTFTLPAYRFPSLNEFVNRHWSIAYRAKKTAKEMVRAYGYNVPKATGKRRVDIHITLSGKQKEYDDDNIQKALLDSLVANLLIVDDDRDGVEMGSITYDRGKKTQTIIYLTELPTAT